MEGKRLVIGRVAGEVGRGVGGMGNWANSVERRCEFMNLQVLARLQIREFLNFFLDFGRAEGER